MSKWIVAHNITYYPYIVEFDTYEEALEYFRSRQTEDEEEGRAYLAEVKETFG